MRKVIYCLLAVLLVGCATTNAVYDLREFPTHRLGVVQAGWVDPNWNIDVWVNSLPANSPPSFILLSGWQKEWTVRADNVSVYARAWIWSNGRKLTIAETKVPIRVEISKTRDWIGYGWWVELNASDFGLDQNSFDHSHFHRLLLW